MVAEQSVPAVFWNGSTYPAERVNHDHLKIVQKNWHEARLALEYEMKSGTRTFRRTTTLTGKPHPHVETNMTRMVIHSRIGADGVLHITVPMGKEDADREVQVTIDPAPVGPPQMRQEEWRAFVLSTAGSITDPSFVRHEQGEYEEREELP